MAARRGAREWARPRGQHFLRSSRLAADIVAGADARGELVVEIGAGTGLLTRALSGVADRVVALELDVRLADRLRRDLARRASVSVVHADAREWAWPDEPFAVVANLPFAGSGELLRLLLDDPRRPLTSATLIVQWEFACKRARVWPSTLRAAYWGAWYEFAVVRHLAPAAFAPPPSVDAGVLRIRRRGQPLVPLEDSEAYRTLLARAFAGDGRLRRVVPPRDLKRVAAAAGFAPDARARELDVHQWAALFRTRGSRSAPPRVKPGV